MAVLSKNDRKVLLDPLFNNNPIALQVLGICSALAVTTNHADAMPLAATIKPDTKCVRGPMRDQPYR